jgi:hypothetical protein
MRISLSITILAAALLAAPLLPSSVAHAQEDLTKRGDRTPSAGKAPKATTGSKAFREKSPSLERSPRVKSEVRREPRVKRPPSEARREPWVKRPPSEVRREPRVKTPSTAKRRLPPAVRHARRPWRPGLRHRWIVVPSLIIAEELNWCHYHAYRVTGMRFHRDVECHQHARWNHPSIRYVEEY